MSKSAIYAVNSSAQNVVDGGTVNFGSIVRRFGCNCQMSNGSVVVSGCGYYDLDINLDFTAAAGSAVISIYKDGVVIPGANATVTTEAATNYHVIIPTMFRQMCECASTISVVISGVATVVNDAAILVEKV